MTKKALFLDRDGTINVDVGYPHRLEDCQLLAGAKEGLHRFHQAGYMLIVITNQSGIGKGMFSTEDFRSFTHYLEKQLALSFDHVYFCPDISSTQNSERKPNPINVFRAQEQFCIDLSQSIFVGDKDSDIQCGDNANIDTARIINDTYSLTSTPTYSIDSLTHLADILDVGS